MDNLFSKGEIAVQKLAGEHQIALTRTPMLMNNRLNGFSIKFIENQEVVYITSVDRAGDTWVSMLFGNSGVFQVINNRLIKINQGAILSNSDDILYENILLNPKVGLLFLSGETRRRFRLNGFVSEKNGGLYLEIEEFYGICPKYIQKRIGNSEETFFAKPDCQEGTGLTTLHRELIKKADTFYLGTQGASHKPDCSHKGGIAGFVSFLNEHTLIIPDYSGNSMFSSLGNIYENPNAALLFIDYQQQTTLQITGKANLQFNQSGEEAIKRSGGTGRFWQFAIQKWQYTTNAFPAKWKFIEYSPFNP